MTPEEKAELKRQRAEADKLRKKKVNAPGRINKIQVSRVNRMNDENSVFCNTECGQRTLPRSVDHTLLLATTHRIMHARSLNVIDIPSSGQPRQLGVEW